MLFDLFRKKKSSDVVIILGMHRSGTSCLTGLLQQAGLELGDVVQAAPFNKKGNRENLEIMALNNAVLSHSNGSWDSPPECLAWNKEHKKERDRIIAKYSDKAAWGFKDPRVVFTLPFWLEGLDQSKVKYIGTFRHPLAVAKSLNARQADFSIEKGVELWRRYNEKLLEYYYQRNGFPLINFDLEPEPYMQSVQEAMKALGVLTIPEGSNLDFFDNTLLHQKKLGDEELAEFAQVLESAMPIYEKLKAIPRC